MKKTAFILFLAALGGWLLAEPITVLNGGQIVVGTEVRFQYGSPGGGGLTWSYGDGTSDSSRDNQSSHVYREPGNFHVTCVSPAGTVGLSQGEVTVTVADNRSVSPQGRGALQGRRVNFQADNFVSNNIRWDFGDGTVESGGRNNGHVYANPGNFTVKAYDFNGDTQTAISCQVAVAADNRQVSADPASPRARQSVAFTASNFSAGSLRWDFGDGTATDGGPAMSHAYAAAGNFQVLVREAGEGQENALKLALAVQPDPRQLALMGPPDIFEGSEVVFDGRNFSSANLRWDFGDGVVEAGPTRRPHRFQRPGNYLVRAVEDGTDNMPVEKRVQVLGENRSLVLKSAMVFVNGDFDIEAQNFRSGTISWDFGDGVVQNGPRKMTHRYARTGVFRVRAVDYAGRDGKSIDRNVQVENDTRVVSLPVEVIAGEEVAMQVQNAAGGAFTWRFSDGESRSGAELRGKAFRFPGPQKLTIIDASGKYPPLERTLQVVPDLRSLKGSAGFILPGEEVTFTALNFRGPAVRWDFGDGTVKENGQMTERHAFGALGRFQVKAVDFGGRSSKTFTSEVVVAEMTPGFGINTLEFAFENGKYYRVIAKNSPGPAYRLRVKARGRGVLSGQFFLDNMSIGLFQLVIQENQVAVLPRSRIAALPTLDLGLHELTLKFTNYTFSQRVPIIKYFVSAAGMIHIKAPAIDARVPSGEKVKLLWAIERKNPRFEIAVSDVPLQFLDDKQIEWLPVGSEPSYLFDPGPFKPDSWIYWQVRLLNESGQVQTTSEIATFKLGN
jgi:PKD repeat protein